MRHFLITLSLIVVVGSAKAEESYSAKSLFFGEDGSVVAVSTSPKNKDRADVVAGAQGGAGKKSGVTQKKPAAPTYIGASFFIRLKNPDGTSRDVLATRAFRSGERFQLGVKVNAPSYIYVLNEDPNGKITQIYPQPGHNNFVNAMGVVFLPTQGAFEFDNVPGAEQLLVYLSPAPIIGGLTERLKSTSPDIVAALPEAPVPNCAALAVNDQTINRDARDNYASKAINYSNDSSCSTVGAKPSSESYASKGIVFSEDAIPEAGGQVASYVVKTKATPDASLFLKIKLVHR